MTRYQNSVIALESKVYSNEFYVSRWEYVKNGRDLQSLSDDDLCSLLNEFWVALPDSMSIHREPFYVLCELCEGTMMQPTEIDEILSSGIRTIQFNKKNGECRKMRCTRDIDEIRKIIPDCEDLERVTDEVTSIIVFDLDKNDWRRFMVENLIEID